MDADDDPENPDLENRDLENRDLENRDLDSTVRDAYQVYYRRLVTQLFGLIGNLAEAEDAVQEAFARVLTRPKSFIGAEDPERWLRVVALNVARTRYRRRWVFDRLVRAGRVDVTPSAAPGLSTDRVELLVALRRLAPPTREAVVLHHLADLPVVEVAATLRVPVGTVKARLARGRTALARFLTDDDPFPKTGNTRTEDTKTGNTKTDATADRDAEEVRHA